MNDWELLNRELDRSREETHMKQDGLLVQAWEALALGTLSRPCLSPGPLTSTSEGFIRTPRKTVAARR
jgi:hypothetical protein